MLAVSGNYIMCFCKISWLSNLFALRRKGVAALFCLGPEVVGCFAANSHFMFR